MKRQFFSIGIGGRVGDICALAFFATLLLTSVSGCSAQRTVESKALEDVEPLADEPQPVAVINETESYLGLLAPGEDVQKSFAIENHGDAPLALRLGGTACNCTTSTVPSEPIQPGQAALVRVSSKIDQDEGKFDHTAVILTNDPKNKRIELRIHGRIQEIIAFEPRDLIASTLKRGEATIVDTLVYSQAFRSFELVSLESTLDGLSWEVEKADELALRAVKARCGYRVKLKIPETASTGLFSEKLTVKARSDDAPPRVRDAECNLLGNVRARADISGNKVSADRILNVGSLRRWEGAQERLTLTIHDEHRRLAIKAIEKTPDFLKVDVVPMVPEKPDSGLYWVHLTIPKDAPASNYVGSRKGEIQIITDHPALPVMSFHVQFAISSS